MRRLLPSLSLAGLALTIDILCKVWAEQTLTLHEPVSILGTFARLTLSYNTGVAFSMFIDGGLLLLGATFAIIVLVGGWSLRALLRGTLPPYSWLAVGLVLGGALGNFVDRLPDGRVTDFIDIGIGATRWPIFNTADIWITTGISLLLILMYLHERHVATPALRARDSLHSENVGQE